MALLDADADAALVRIRDLAGRTRGTGFLADHDGTIVTSHEAVDGAERLVLQPMAASGSVSGTAGWSRPAEPTTVTPLPEAGLALVRTDDHRLRRLVPLPVATGRPAPGTGARIWAGGWLDGTVTGPASGVTYTATDRVHLLDETLELGLCAGGREALRLGGPAVGGPVLDARTGTVLGVLGTALHSGRRAGGFAIPLRAVAEAVPRGALAALLERNARTVPAYGSELNAAGALRLTAVLAGRSERPPRGPEAVERPDVAEEFRYFADGDGPGVLALVGEPGTGRSTELARFTARRAAGPDAGPAVRLRGAELRAGDDGVRAAVGRALRSAGQTLAAAGRTAGDPADLTPDAVARLARATGRPLLVLLDAPEEMPADLARRERLAAWTAATADWLRTAGVRLVLACRPAYWEQAGPLFPPGLLHRPRRPLPGLPACTGIGDLPEAAAELARRRYRLPAGAPAAPDARHPLALRLLAEVGAELLDDDGPCGDGPDGDGRRGDGSRGDGSRGDGQDGDGQDGDGSRGDGPYAPGAGGAADGPPPVLGSPDRHEIFDAYLGLMCLRIARRIAAAHRPGPRGTAVRRLAAQVTGQVHEAARRCLGSGPGALDRTAFEEVFPPGSGWAAAVLAEGLLVAAGPGYRFAHEEFAEWLQGAHADPDLLPVPGGLRFGPAVHGLLLLARRQGTVQLTFRLAELAQLATAADDGDANADAEPGGRDAASRRWSAQVLAGVLLRVPDARPYTGVLRLLADRITERSLRAGGFARTGLAAFGPWFWARLALPDGDRMDLLRRLLPADGPPAGPERRRADRLPFARPPRVRVHPVPPEPAPGEPAPEAPGEPPAARPTRFLDAAAALLSTDPGRIQPLLCAWFDDPRPLQRRRGTAGRTRPAPGAPSEITVAGAAQALLHTHRRPALDELTEALVAAAHPKGDELLDALAEDEPSAMCRAVHRWAHDERPRRRLAAVTYGLRVAPYATGDTDRALLRRTALRLLSRPADEAHHGSALALLVGDPASRPRFLERALARFVAGDPQLPPTAFTDALTDCPDAVLAAFRTRLTSGEGPPVAAALLRLLARLDTPDLAARAAAVVRCYAGQCPERAARPVAEFLAHRLERGPAARATLRPLAVELLTAYPAPVRCALAAVLAETGSGDSAPLRRELLEVLLAYEASYADAVSHSAYGDGIQDTRVLEALLRAAAEGVQRRPEDRTRELVHRTGMLLIRTPEGAACFDRELVELGRRVPGFARRVQDWLVAEPGEWAAVVGPGARATLAGCLRG
ncbi:DNA-binding protein [Streptomyces sp. NBRC 110611]|uniref:trypsin-like peptidase domain-containing protein n=1 Tax=Streptomyces sp. NBRC 110611 TaxID=1621259 RepID=UPI000855BA43|nr:trypsin-like peptidase domain-containing protein [Streptomyces sp. NBRC 110611]GAU70046.1 DNA-binding protein [Streptomyces sp. NBRC 110611]